MGFIWSYLKKYPGRILGSLLGSLFFVTVTLGLPTVFAQVIDQVFPSRDLNLLYSYAVIMIVLVLIGFTGQMISRYFVAKLASGVTRDIRNDFYSKTLNLSYAEFQEFGVPSLSTRITTDAFMVLQFVVLLMGMGLTAPIMTIVSTAMAVSISPSLGSFALPVVPIIALIIFMIARVSSRLSTKQQETLDRINQTQRENINGLRVIRAFNREGFQEERFEDANIDYRIFSKKLYEMMSIPQPAFIFILNISMVIILYVGASYVGSGEIQVGSLVAMINYIIEALFSIIIFSNIFMMYPRAKVSSQRLKKVMDAPISVKNKENPITETDGSGTLEFINVDFCYPDADEPVLRDISFKSHAGETTAFIGSTGSGKSTIVKLIPRFYDVTKGEILLDGINIKDIDLKTLREKVGYTPQKANLFTGPIAENLRYGKQDATIEDMDYSTEIAQAREFISKLETGYDTHLAEGGSNLSGGQKQRLSIARSLIGNHEVYIFDDSFSALDYKTDAKLRKALAEEIKDATTIIVAQRVSTIMNADQIIVLDHGKIAGKGTHKELMETSELYRDIAYSQLSEEELGNV